MAKCPWGTEVQTLLFPKSRYTKLRALQWCTKHGYRNSGARLEGKHWRVRQVDPSKFKRGSFRTISFGSGIQAVIGCPR